MATDPTRGGTRRTPVTPEEAVAGIRSEERVFIGTAEPDSLVEALTARAGTLRDVRLIPALTFGPARYVAPERARSFCVRTFFIAPNVREAEAEGEAGRLRPPGSRSQTGGRRRRRPHAGCPS